MPTARKKLRRRDEHVITQPRQDSKHNPDRPRIACQPTAPTLFKFSHVRSADRNIEIHSPFPTITMKEKHTKHPPKKRRERISSHAFHKMNPMYSVYLSINLSLSLLTLFRVTCDISSVVPHTSFFPSQSLPLQPNLTFSTQEFSNHYLFWPRAPIWTLAIHSSPVHTRYSNSCKTNPNTYLLRETFHYPCVSELSASSEHTAIWIMH